MICEPRGTEAGFVTCAPRRFDRGADCRTFTATCLGGLLTAHVMNPAGVGRGEHVNFVAGVTVPGGLRFLSAESFRLMVYGLIQD